MGALAAKGKYDFYNYDLIYGIIAIIIGIVTIIYSSAIGSVFRVIIGIWIIYSSSNSRGIYWLYPSCTMQKGKI